MFGVWWLTFTLSRMQVFLFGWKWNWENQAPLAGKTDNASWKLK